jgi:heme-degrading monooxygenase HmoA
MADEFVALWSFEVRPESRSAFLSAYGSGGDWEQLFLRASGYLGSELWEELDRGGHFFTVDRWSSLEAYREFLVHVAAVYDEIDRRCQPWMLRENAVGRFRLQGESK